MKNLKKNLPVILLSVCATLLLVIVILLINNGNTFKFSNKSGNKETNKENTKEIKKDSKKEEIKESKEESKKEEIKEEKKEEKNTVETTPTTPEKSEDSLISFFENEEKGISNSESFKDKAKNTFTSIIDFIFYDKEIKGYTFKELTSSAKLKIISIALKVDNKIDSYFPNYKEKIKDKYNDFKGKLALKYLEVSSEFCAKNPDAYSQAKEDLSNMKESFGLTFDLLKEMLKSGTSKVKDLYENWRDE